ncbi:ABC transporter ATP-binding protein [Paenibacillus sp. SYP-B3998]|uniref:ABC transporter ATP-binding protein n=2 Tax=Paenibacillus sp. SYP-B3998 TaxID=2678564 RepID=A0A6G4A2A0_9BACL|nr:ABC transporter ATP-binding protein [Paenibacillus sp. SYP-B3998]
MIPNGGIGVTQLRLKYPGEHAPLLFQGVSLSIEPGEKVLLLGPSGCGKSTLLQVLSGIVPHTVEMPLKAEEIKTPTRWGYVFQDPDTQFCMPYVDEEIAFVLENLQIPREQMLGLIQRYLDMAGLRFTDVHTPIGQLSQGMKQRLAIASVLALEPDVLFLDEPTALLDEEGTKQVWHTIRMVSADKTLVIVEHKISGILDFIDRLIVMAPDGHLLADGRPQDIFASYKQQLIEYGIWYPGVWDDYDRQRALQMSRVQEQQQEHGVDKNNLAAELRADSITWSEETAEAGRVSSMENSAVSDSSVLMSMQNFVGIRGGQMKTSVDNLIVNRGDWIAVVGANGAGKSSLLLAIMRLIQTKGSCWIKGVQGSKVEQLAERVAFVFQNPEFQFVTHSVEEEIAYSLPEETQHGAVEKLLKEYDLLALRRHHPFQLSMGQKRRLSVASAMVREPSILLLDEPTFGLDARNTFRMLEQLERLRESGTVIMMITHDDEIVKRFTTRVWQVEAGQVSERELKQPPLQSLRAAEGEIQLCK